MLKTIKIYTTEIEANLDLTILESFGIKSYIFNSFSSSIYPIFNSTIGGFELKVAEDDLQKALEILNDKPK